MLIYLIHVLSKGCFFLNLTLFILASFLAHINIISETKIAFFRAIIARSTLLFYNLISRHFLNYWLLFLNFCGSAIFNFKIQRLQLGSFSQNFLGIIINLLNIFIIIADLIFRLVIFDLTLYVPFRWTWSPYEPFFILSFHYQFDRWISLKIIEILIYALKWIFFIH